MIGGRIPQRASEVTSGLGVVVRALPTGSVTSGNGQPSESDVVDDHIRLRQHQKAAITCNGIRIGSGHVMHPGQTECCETVDISSCGTQLSSGRGPSEMISDHRTHSDREVLVKGVGERAASDPSVGTLAAGLFGSGR
jgi:hypothetical protein